MTDPMTAQTPAIKDRAIAQPEWSCVIVPDTARVAWGARAIYRIIPGGRVTQTQPRRITTRAVVEIDILHDRQAATSAADATSSDLRKLETWINRKGLPAIRRLCLKRFVTTDCEDVIEFVDGLYVIKASPRGSYGYLYLTAWAHERNREATP